MEVKENKKFYKQWWFIVIVVIAAIICATTMVNTIKGMFSGKKVDWETVELGEYLPKTELKNGNIKTDRKDLLIVEFKKITKEEYKDYVKQCISAGYNIDLEYENWDTVYGAYNNKNYNIRISYLEYGKEMNITLEAPEKMEQIEWPTNGLGTKVPKVKSNYGKISWNNSESFIIHVGNTTKQEYNEYVKECENVGYINDYSKGEKTYLAKNQEGYRINLMYLGGNVMEVSVKPPEGKTSAENQETNTTQEGNTQTSNMQVSENTQVSKPETPSKIETPKKPTQTNNGLRREFKEAMDSYEKFMNEYVTFMKKYEKSDGTDLSLIADYAKYMSKYTDMVKKFEKWEDEELNSAEMAYYVDVQARVTKKLLEVTD